MNPLGHRDPSDIKESQVIEYDSRGQNHDGDGDGLSLTLDERDNTTTVQKQSPTSGFWLFFHDNELEGEFLVEEYFRCRWRLALNAFSWCLAGITFSLVFPEKRSVTFPLAFGSGTILVTQLCLILLDRLLLSPPSPPDVQGVGESDTNYVSPQKGTTHRQIHALCQEILASICGFYQAVMYTYLDAVAQNEARCFFVYKEGDDTDAHNNDENCPLRLYQFFFFSALLPVIVGQPRFATVIFVFLATFLTAVITYRLHNVSPGGQIILFVFIVVYLVALGVLKRFNEAQLRKRFVLRKVVQQQRQEAEEGNRTLKEFVLQITPKHLHSKLQDPSGILTADASTNATCVVVQIHDSLAFMHSMLPTQAATLLSIFFLHVEKEAESCGSNLEHIRTHGDTTILVNGLVASSRDTAKDGAIIKAILGFTMALPRLAHSHHEKLNVVCGVAQGALAGMPLGTSCIRYDLFGPALQKAMALVASCKKNNVNIDDHLTARLTNSEEVSSAAASLCGDGKMPQSHDGPTTAGKTWNSKITEEVESSVSAEFDPISVIAGRVEEERNGNGERTDVAPVSIQTGQQLLAPSLTLVDTCCWSSHFLDRTVNAEAHLELKREARVPFFFVNIFMGLFNIICCISVAEERGDHIANDLAPLSRLFCTDRHLHCYIQCCCWSHLVSVSFPVKTSRCVFLDAVAITCSNVHEPRRVSFCSPLSCR